MGYKNIFNYNTDEFNITYYPKEIYINGVKQDIISSSYYLNETINLVELIWNNSIDRPGFMFYGCIDITEIDLSKFDTSLNIDTRYMFRDCISLTSLNLNNFNTSLVTEMFDMFRNCSSLTSLDLSSFDTSNVGTITNMFNGCVSLTSLNLSNFVSNKLSHMAFTFQDCSNLEYINLKNIHGNRLYWFEGLFMGVPDNIVICINKGDRILFELNYKICYVIDCSDNWKLNQKKIELQTGACANTCYSFSEYKYEYNGKCYKDCPNGYLTYDNNTITHECKCELEYCLLCPSVALNKKLCTKCNKNYYSIENDPSNIGEYIKCYSNPEGYYNVTILVIPVNHKEIILFIIA